MANPSKLRHPTFGACELVPSIVLVRWRAPTTRDAASSALSAAALTLSSEAAPGRADARNPLEAPVNDSSFTSFATGKDLKDADLKKLAASPNVEWVGPVYRASAAEKGERSYFAINPSVIVLTAQAAGVADVPGLAGSAVVDAARTSLLKGFVVYELPERNALDVAEKLLAVDALRGLPNAVSFENIPYLSPLCSGCGCAGSAGGGAGEHGSAGDCAPSALSHIPNDALFANQWGLQRINAPRAWPITKGDPNVVVAVLDQGVELGHPDLHLWPISYSTITHTNDGSAVGNHGTPCAGIISGRMDNGLGATGLAPECRVMAIATMFSDVQVAEGLFYAADNGARVVSMSFGVYPNWMIWNFAVIEAALQYCHSKNVALIAATGNEDQAVSRFPATDPRTFGVGGSNRMDVRKSTADGSLEPFWGACFGPDCDVVAPCLEIPSTDRLGAFGYTATDYTTRFNGTSSATPHVAALAGLLLSVDASLSNTDLYRLIAESADKINLGPYVYAPTAGKPFGTWTAEVGYGRINAERALLMACAHRDGGKCGVSVPQPEACCVSPCDPPWRPDEHCLVWYDERVLRLPIAVGNQGRATTGFAAAAARQVLEFKITYEHRLCLLGKQHGPLAYTTTLLPGESVRLYHSERYRRITSAQQRYSVQTTFMQFLSVVHRARVSNSLDALSSQLESDKSSSSESSAGGFFFGLVGGGRSGSEQESSSSSSHTAVGIHSASESFRESVMQASQLTRAERSLVISTYEEKETQDISVRTLHNANECRAVTYFVRQVMELYAQSTRVASISFRVLSPGLLGDWRSIDELDGLPAPIRNAVLAAIKLLPKVGQVVTMPRPITIPTDGVVYDAELAHCGSCEPERAAAVQIRLKKAEAEALRACLEVKELELELERRRLLLGRGNLAPFTEPAALPAAGGSTGTN
jgi:hypothetical protein